MDENVGESTMGGRSRGTLFFLSLEVTFWGETVGDSDSKQPPFGMVLFNLVNHGR